MGATMDAVYAHDLEANRNKQPVEDEIGSSPLHQQTLYRPVTHSTVIGPTPAELNPEAHKRNFREFGNPAPLGLSAFALTTFVLSLCNVDARGLLGKNSIVIAPAFFYGGFVQLLAGMWEMAVGNTFGATALSSYGGFWISLAAILSPSFQIQAGYSPELDGGRALHSALGIFMVGWFLFTCVLTLCTVRSTLSFFLLFFLLDITFLVLGISYFLDENVTLMKTGGVFGLIASLLAWYCAFAGLANRENSFMKVTTVPFPWSTPGQSGRHASKDA